MFGVLGPLTISIDGQLVVVAAPKRRALLALLILHRNAPLPIGRVVAELWDADPPCSALENVRSYVSGLRTALGAYRDRLLTGHQSYLLQVSDDEVDAAVFARQADEAAGAAAAGDWARAGDGYGQALRLWRGDPLGDVPTGRLLSAYALSLRETRCRALESYLLSLSRSGRADQAIAGLRQLVAGDPTRESSWYALISALYDAGDRVAALDAYQQARMNLADHLGLDPGAELARLHADLLSGVRHARSSPQLVARRAVPRQLPPAPVPLVGRELERSRLEGILTAGGEGEAAGAPRIASIHGIGGVGKSSLAITLAHAIRAEYLDGQIYLDLQGASPVRRPVSPVAALQSLLRALRVPEDQLSPSLDDSVALYRSYTADRSILLVLDNALDAAQVRPLLPATARSTVLITSRCRLDTLDGVNHVRLQTLSPDASLALLSALTNPDVVRSDVAAATEVAELCGNLPLALRIVGLRACRHSVADLRDIACRLRHERSLLDELGHADLSVRATFAGGYSWLAQAPGLGAVAARVFRLLGTVALPTFGTAEVSALAQLDEATSGRVLDLLVDHGLAEHRRGFQWHLHDLLRSYARELAEQIDNEQALLGAQVRLAQWFITVIRNSRPLYEPSDGDPPRDTDLAGDPRVPADIAQAQRWLEHHAAVLSGLSLQLHANPHTRVVAWQLLRPLARRLTVGFPSMCIMLHEPLVQQDDPDHQPELIRGLCTLASANMFLGRSTESLRHAERARHLVEDVEDIALRARVHSVYGSALDATGHAARAITHHLKAITLFQTLGRHEPVHICLSSASEAAIALEWYQEALAMLRRGMAVGRTAGRGKLNWGAMLDQFAKVHLRLGRPRLAIRYATNAITWAERQGLPSLHAHGLQARALAWQEVGEHDRAIADARASVEIAQVFTSTERVAEAQRVLAGIQHFDDAAETGAHSR